MITYMYKSAIECSSRHLFSVRTEVMVLFSFRYLPCHVVDWVVVICFYIFVGMLSGFRVYYWFSRFENPNMSLPQPQLGPVLSIPEETVIKKP